MEECIRLVKEADYEFTDVLVTIASPLSLLVRHHSTALFLAETHPLVISCWYTQTALQRGLWTWKANCRSCLC